MKVLAMYLPQFHRVKENDEWWGEGFTEWVSVKDAEQFFDGHDQPRVPQNRNYYDLLNRDTMIWQSSLMKKYQIDGICMYHYWFKHGKQILEKPAQNLLRWKEIYMPFCFCWANETWARSWSKIQNKNVWSKVREQNQNGTENGILLEQDYGNEVQWRKHFEYLLPFFRDERYIKVEGRPLFLIYKETDIPCLPEMLECWKKLAKLNGLNGIYIIGAGENTDKRYGIDAKLYHQPSRSIKQIPAVHAFKGRQNINVWNYEKVWEKILNEEPDGKVYFEGFVGYDDTPRRGKEGSIVFNPSPERFSYYLAELMAKSAAYQNEIVFINAWNEWGEGMYLEPDERYAEKYLNAVSCAKSHYSHLVDKYKKEVKKKKESQQIEELNKVIDKNVHYLHLLDQWMMLREKGYLLENKLFDAGYRKIAVYGYGIFGRHLESEFIQNKVTIEYIIDQQKDKINADIPVYSPQEDLPEAELVVVTAVCEYDEIYKKIREKSNCKMISLETLIFETEL